MHIANCISFHFTIHFDINFEINFKKWFLSFHTYNFCLNKPPDSKAYLNKIVQIYDCLWCWQLAVDLSSIYVMISNISTLQQHTDNNVYMYCQQDSCVNIISRQYNGIVWCCIILLWLHDGNSTILLMTILKLSANCW